MTNGSRRQYAAGTDVSVARSQQEVKEELQRLGATKRQIYEDDDELIAVVKFQRETIQYRLTLHLSDPDRPQFWNRGGNQHTRGVSPERRAREAWAQDTRERWRALAEYVRALRIADEAGIEKAETFLLPYAVLPEGQTVAEYLGPQLPQLYASGRMPPLLPGATAPGAAIPLALPERSVVDADD